MTVTIIPAEPTPVALLTQAIHAVKEPFHRDNDYPETGFTAWDIARSAMSNHDRAEGFVVLLGYYTAENYSTAERKRRARNAIRRFLATYLNLPDDLMVWRETSSGWPCAALNAGRLETLANVTGAKAPEPLTELPTTSLGGYRNAARDAYHDGYVDCAADICAAIRQILESDARLKLPPHSMTLGGRHERLTLELRNHILQWLDTSTAVDAAVQKKFGE